MSRVRLGHVQGSSSALAGVPDVPTGVPGSTRSLGGFNDRRIVRGVGDVTAVHEDAAVEVPALKLKRSARELHRSRTFAAGFRQHGRGAQRGRAVPAPAGGEMVQYGTLGVPVGNKKYRKQKVSRKTALEGDDIDASAVGGDETGRTELTVATDSGVMKPSNTIALTGKGMDVWGRRESGVPIETHPQASKIKSMFALADMHSSEAAPPVQREVRKVTARTAMKLGRRETFRAGTPAIKDELSDSDEDDVHTRLRRSHSGPSPAVTDRSPLSSRVPDRSPLSTRLTSRSRRAPGVRTRRQEYHGQTTTTIVEELDNEEIEDAFNTVTGVNRKWRDKSAKGTRTIADKQKKKYEPGEERLLGKVGLEKETPVSAEAKSPEATSKRKRTRSKRNESETKKSGDPGADDETEEARREKNRGLVAQYAGKKVGCWAIFKHAICGESSADLQKKRKAALRGAMSVELKDPDLIRAVRAAQLGPDSIATLYRNFLDIDITVGGLITSKEYFKWLDFEETPFTAALFERCLVNTTTEGTLLSFDDFVSVHLYFCLFTRREILRFMFNLFDADASGKLTEAEFVTLLRLVNHPEPTFPGNFQRALDEFDVDGDGEIDFGEFQKLNSSYPQVLFRGFRLQDEMQRKTLGRDMWVSLAERRADQVKEMHVRRAKVKAKREAVMLAA